LVFPFPLDVRCTTNGRNFNTDETSNEITAIPELLRLLDTSGALVSGEHP